MSEKVAWRGSACGVRCVVAAASRGKAKRLVLGGAHAGYYDHAKWTDIRVERAREYDDWASVDESGLCWNEHDLATCKNRNRLNV